MIHISKRKIKGYLYSIFLFFLIFNPPFFKGISFTIIFVILSIIYCACNINTLVKIYRHSYLKELIRTFVIIYLILVLFEIIHLFSRNAELIVSNIQDLVIDNFSIIIVSCACTLMFYKENYSFQEIIEMYVRAGIIEALFGVACFISPAIKNNLNQLMSVNSSAEKIARTLQYTSSYRNYGIASSLYDIFGLTMSILAILAFYAAQFGKKKNYLFAVLIAFVAILNARTSIIMCVIGVLIIALKGRKSKNKIVSIILIILIIILGFTAAFSQTQVNSSSDNVSWLLSGVNDILALLFEHRNTGYFYTLFNDFIFFPKGVISNLFGTGLTSLQYSGKGSDVGYVENIWQYGIIGSILIYYTYLKIFNSLNKAKNKVKNILSLIFMVLVAVYLVKLNCLGYTMAMVIIMPICFYGVIK